MEQEKKSAVSLKTLLTPSKVVSLDYPGFEGFSVDLCYLARDELLKLRNRCVSQKLNKKTRAFEEMLDDDKFLVEYTSAVIKGWKGLKYKHLEKMVLIDVKGLNLEDELPFSQENAQLLMQNCSGFDLWVTESTQELENFTQVK